MGDNELHVAETALRDIEHDALKHVHVDGVEISDEEDSDVYSAYLLGIDGEDCTAHYLFSGGHTPDNERDLDAHVRALSGATHIDFGGLLRRMDRTPTKTIAALLRIVRSDGAVGYFLYHHPVLDAAQAAGFLISALEARTVLRRKTN